MKKNIFLNFSVSTLLVLVIFACSQERLTPLVQVGVGTEKIVDFNPVYEYNNMESLQKPIEKVTISSRADIPYTTKKGSIIWIYEENLKDQNGKKVSYPYDLEIIELLTYKDIILFNKPTTSNNLVLSTGGALYVQPVKDKQNLLMAKRPRIDFFGIKSDPEMRLFYQEKAKEGGVSGDRMTWVLAGEGPGRPLDSLSIDRQKVYQIFPAKYGWINCDKFANFQGEKTKITISSTYPELKSIMIFLVIPRITSVIAVYDGKSLELPVGEKIKLVAVAKSVEKEYYASFKEIVIEKDMQINIKLSPTTEADYLANLEKL